MAEVNEFKDLTLPELKHIAQEFAVDLDGKTKKADIIKTIEDDGVSFKMYQDLLVPDGEETEVDEVTDYEPIVPGPVDADPEEEGVQVVLKMVRKNWTYEIRGYRFSQDHPYAMVSEEDADYLIEEDGGFRMASPRELREFYGA